MLLRHPIILKLPKSTLFFYDILSAAMAEREPIIEERKNIGEQLAEPSTYFGGCFTLIGLATIMTAKVQSEKEAGPPFLIGGIIFTLISIAIWNISYRVRKQNYF